MRRSDEGECGFYRFIPSVFRHRRTTVPPASRVTGLRKQSPLFLLLAFPQKLEPLGLETLLLPPDLLAAFGLPLQLGLELRPPAHLLLPLLLSLRLPLPRPLALQMLLLLAQPLQLLLLLLQLVDLPLQLL